MRDFIVLLFAGADIDDQRGANALNTQLGEALWHFPAQRLRVPGVAQPEGTLQLGLRTFSAVSTDFPAVGSRLYLSRHLGLSDSECSAA